MFSFSEEIKEKSVKLKRWGAKHKHKLFKKKKPDHDTILRVKTAIRDLDGDYETESRLWDIIVLLKSIPNPPDLYIIHLIIQEYYYSNVCVLGENESKTFKQTKYMSAVVALLDDKGFSKSELYTLYFIYVNWCWKNPRASFDSRMEKYKEEQDQQEIQRRKELQERQRIKELQRERDIKAYNERTAKYKEVQDQQQIKETKQTKKIKEIKEDNQNTQICNDWLS